MAPFDGLAHSFTLIPSSADGSAPVYLYTKLPALKPMPAWMDAMTPRVDPDLETFSTSSLSSRAPSKEFPSTPSDQDFDNGRAELPVEEAPLISPVILALSKKQPAEVKIAAIQRYHRKLGVTLDSSEIELIGNSVGGPLITNSKFTPAARQEFLSDPAKVPAKYRRHLEQDYGKNSLRQCFTSEASFRHVLLPVLKGSYLDDSDRASLFQVSRRIERLWFLIVEFGHWDIEPYRGFATYADWENETDLNEFRINLLTAAMIQFTGNVAEVIRWWGGPHTGAQRDIDAIIRLLRQYQVDETRISNLEQLYRNGGPFFCHAESTEENFRTYRDYGNHKSCQMNPTLGSKTLTKDFRRGFTILMDHVLVDFLPHVHLNPQGIVNASHPSKDPRQVFDSSFHPTCISENVNDWTTIDTEPPIEFASAEGDYRCWIWNLRINYPNEIIYLAEDDAQGAFRWCKYHPSLVSMHSFVQDYIPPSDPSAAPRTLLGMQTGESFGGCTSVPNWQVIASARQDLAQKMWSDPSIVQKAAKYIPDLKFDAVSRHGSSYAQANADSYNHGVLDPTGKRLPPPFSTHVDDALYADVRPFMPQTVSASVASLVGVLGEPIPEAPEPLSRKKFNPRYNDERMILGKHYNSTTMTVSLSSARREKMIAMCKEWLFRSNCSLRELASFVGIIVDASQYNPWAKVYILTLQDQLRSILLERWKALSAIFDRRNRKVELARQLPSDMAYRIEKIVAKEVALFLWNARPSPRFPVSKSMKASIKILYQFLRDPVQNPWSSFIGHMIPRDPAFVAVGDAGLTACGGHIRALELFCFIPWSPQTRARLSTSACAYSVESWTLKEAKFVSFLLLVAAAQVALAQIPPARLAKLFPEGVPPFPILSTSIGGHTSKELVKSMAGDSPRSQALLRIYAELIVGSELGTAPMVEASPDENLLVAVLSSSELSNFSDAPYRVQIQQIFLSVPEIVHWQIFLPSQELRSLLLSTLFSASSVERPVVPSNLGVVVPCRHISSSSCSM